MIDLLCISEHTEPCASMMFMMIQVEEDRFDSTYVISLINKIPYNVP